jgi:subtilisin family serine protease
MPSPKSQTGEASSHEKIVEKAKRQYLIAPRRGSQAMRAAIRPLSAEAMKGVIGNIPNMEVVKVLKPKKVISTFSAMANESNETYVVKLDRNNAELLKQSAPPHLIVEQDRYLDYGGRVGPPCTEAPVRPLRSMSGIRATPVKFRVLGDGDVPLPNTKITLQGDAFAQDGVTDKNGELTLTLHSTGNSPPRSLFVDPMRDYWDRFLISPDISLTDVNILRMISLKRALTGFPGSYKYGWGQRLMALDQLPPNYTGKGVKIAVIDSGSDSAHPLLKHLQVGKDLTNNLDEKTWAQDAVGHGTHCAGVITGRFNDEIALRGFAPEADVFTFKIFPGGQFSSLLEALDQCMALDVDIVNMSLGSDQPSQAVEQKLEELVQDGVACIVAAGNSGGPVQYPASSPNVLAVSAIGRLKEFPSEAWDARTVTENQVTPDGLFSPSFTCFGPQIAVTAPGVSIVSSVPDNGFEPQSGTSMAAPHVTGLAALLLAHHPGLQGPVRARGPQRVAALFQLIKSSCVPVGIDPQRTGAGIPTLHGLIRALASQPQAQAPGIPTNGHPNESATQPTPVAAPPTSAAPGESKATQAPTGAMMPQGLEAALLPYLIILSQRPDALVLLNQWLAQGMINPQIAVTLANALVQLSAQSARQPGTPGGVQTMSLRPGNLPVYDPRSIPGAGQFPMYDWSQPGGFNPPSR